MCHSKSKLLQLVGLLSFFFFVNGDDAPKPDAIFEVEQLAVKQVKAAWELTNIDPGENVTMSISEFWRQLKLVLQTIHVELKKYDRRILNNRPASLMNKVLDLQDLSTLRTLSDSDSKNPFVKWRVKWIELSSMASHIHRLYNKRLRDIMNDEPYIKTVAQSIQKYMGYPWYSKLSGNIDENYRFLIRHFPDWIEQRIMSVTEGDLFIGLRRLIDENPTAKSSSSIENGDCKGSQTIGKVVPYRLEGPTFVLLYLALVDVKYYILINFYYIYLWVYESIPFFKTDKLAEEMKERVEKKVDLYLDAFRGFGNPGANMPAPVEPGFFRCDPAAIAPDNPTRTHVYKTTFIKVTNFLKVFIAPEKTFRASGTCKGSCDMIDGTRPPCNDNDTDCLADIEEDCAKNPSTCAAFKPPCPVQDTVCIDSALNASYCPSTNKDRVLEWADLNNKTFGEHTHDCNESIVSFKGSWVMENEPVADTPTMCEVCMCHCYSPIGEDLSTVRSFSLKPAVATTSENKIVVGVKFEQVKDQIHLMVAEAKALPKSKVDPSTILWRKPRPANESGNQPQLIKLRRNVRIFHLDDLVAPPEHVVTGIRFIQGSYEGVYLHEYIGIEIQVQKIDSSGTLVPKTAKWIGNNNSSMSREPYNYVDPDDPVKADGPALPDSSSNQFVSFRATSITKDLGQNTIPYFDAQRVMLEEEKSGWLRGVGLFHKSRSRFGGFLALKIMPFDKKVV